MQSIAQTPPSPGAVQKIDANINRAIGQAVDLSSTLISQYETAKKVAEAANSSRATVADLEGTIATLNRVKGWLKYTGYALFVVDFALSFIPQQDKTYTLLQTVDQKVSLLGPKLDDAVSEINSNQQLVVAIDSIRDIAGQYSATFRTMDAFLAQKASAPANGGAAQDSPLAAYFAGMQRQSAGASAGVIGGYCKVFANQKDIFAVLADATNGATGDVTSFGTQILMLLTQLQRVDTYDTSYRNSEFLRIWPNESDRKQAAAQAVADVFDQYYADCAGALQNALENLNKDGVISDYVTRLYRKHAARAGDSDFPKFLGALLKQNFPQKDWLVIAYDDVAGFDNHGWVHGSGAVSFRSADNAANKATIVAWENAEPFASSDNRWTTCRSRWPDGPYGPDAEEGTVPNANATLNRVMKDSVLNVRTTYCPDLSAGAVSFQWYGNRSTVDKLASWSSNEGRAPSDTSTPSNWKCSYGLLASSLRSYYCPPFSVVMLGRPRMKDQQIMLWTASNTNNRLYLNGSRAEIGPRPSKEESAVWNFEPADEGYYRIKNSDGNYLHLENRKANPAVGFVQMGWYSAMWEIMPLYRRTVDMPGTGKQEVVLSLIRNRWTEQYLALENGGGVRLSRNEPAFGYWLLPGLKWKTNAVERLTSLD